MLRRLIAAIGVAALIGSFPGPAVAEDPLDPAHNAPLPCELVSMPGMAPRSAKNIAHLANVCGFVGTDVEFQSRVDVHGAVHDYAFVGTMGAGLRIFDITDPRHPTFVGAYTDPGWEDDVQVRGDLATVNFDPLVVGINVSTCLRQKDPAGSLRRGGVDFIKLEYDRVAAAERRIGTFTTKLLGCYVSQQNARGAHNATIHPSGDWLAMDNSRDGIEVVDLRNNAFTFVRKIPSGVVGAAHDIFFSRDGNTLYSAGVGVTTIADVTDILDRNATLIASIPNAPTPDGQTIEISHQADVSADEKILIIGDERGGGLDNVDCNVNGDPTSVIGGAHFWALRPITGLPGTTGAGPATPKKLGTWIYPNPKLALDPLDPILSTLPRSERGCTIHVFRAGGDGSNVPGELAPGFDGVSRLPIRQLTAGHYGAGVWWIDFSAAPDAADGIVEDSRTTWGNTLGWNVMPGADTWSAKEYKGFVYAGDMARGFDVYSFASCEGVGCVILPTSSPGSASGGGKLESEILILRGTTAGGQARFGFAVSYVAGALAPGGELSYHDRTLNKRVEATSFDSFNAVGTKATFTGLATVNGDPGVRFVVEVEDLGKSGDLFRIVLQDGYAAAGVVQKGNIEVRSGP